MIVKEELISGFIRALQEVKSCPRCILRFLGERNTVKYLRPDESLNKLNRGIKEDSNKAGMEIDEDISCKSSGDDDKKENHVESSLCIACLGLLQNHCDSSLAHQVSKKVKEEGYEFSTFSLSVTTPLSLIIREQSVFLFLKDKFGSDYTPDSSCPISSVKEVMKWLCGPIVGRDLGVHFEIRSEFKVNVQFTHCESEKELGFLAEIDPSRFQQSKRRKRDIRNQALYTAPAIEKAIKGLKTSDEFRKYFFCPPKASLFGCECSEIFCSHGSVYIAGRYRKYSRVLPQSPWLIDGERHLESSVEEKICESLEDQFRAADHRFTAAGREDVDVRMLGDGRPFVVELINPRRIKLNPQELRKLQNEVNSNNKDIGIRDLQMVTKEDCTTIKDAENNKTKKYCALIYTIEEVKEEELACLPDSKDLVLAQKTPLRVLHRRNLAVREKTIHDMRGEWIDPHHFKLYLCTQAGTYIKEFVHGDFGRTKPHLGLLINKETDILQLDVESVDVNWPPKIEDDTQTESEDAG